MKGTQNMISEVCQMLVRVSKEAVNHLFHWLPPHYCREVIGAHSHFDFTTETPEVRSAAKPKAAVRRRIRRLIGTLPITRNPGFLEE